MGAGGVPNPDWVEKIIEKRLQALETRIDCLLYIIRVPMI